MVGQIVRVNILPSTYTPQTEPDRGDKPQAGIRHVTARRNSYALWEAPLAHPAKNLPGHDSPQHPFGCWGSSSFHRNNRPNCRQAVGEGLSHLDVGSL